MTMQPLCRIGFLFWIAIALLPASLAQDPQEARLILHSQPGDFIGLGRDYDLTYQSPDGFPINPWIQKKLPNGQPTEIFFWLQNSISTPDYSTATLTFNTTGLGLPLQPGMYPGAVRSVVSGPGQPGLDVGFAGRGCNELSGSFSITDVSFFNDPTGALKVGTFAATFEQHCEGAAPALFGAFTYRNLTAPAPIPEPATLALLAATLPAMVLRRKRAQDPKPR